MNDSSWNNPTLAALRPAGGRYRLGDIDRIAAELSRYHVLRMDPLKSGLFPAAAVDSEPGGSGYHNVWVRDNVYVAYSHLVSGRPEVARGVANALVTFFGQHRHRFDAIINGEVDPEDVMSRPHIRFDGEHLREISGQQWSHAQNDAIGYALWLLVTLSAADILPLDSNLVEVLARFPRYLAAIRYWQDEDSGHWEETRRRSGASIGAVVAGLGALGRLISSRSSTLRAAGFPSRLMDSVCDIEARGRSSLNAILPSECIQPSPRQHRRYDASLLFLVYPLGVVDGTQSDMILSDVERYLTGAHGIRRYLGDSYWAPDYDDYLSAADRTKDFSDDMSARDSLLDSIGHEAQWCIFDPLLSAYYGARYRETGATADRDRQVRHLERSLSQITETWKCPELYYLKRGEYIPNPHTPLLWTQANLTVALHEFRRGLPNGQV